MSNIPPPHHSDPAALRLLRKLETDGAVRAYKIGKAWRIKGPQHDLMVAALGLIVPADLEIWGRQ